MKIIDFERKGNVIKLYLGDNDCFWMHCAFSRDREEVPFDVAEGEPQSELVQRLRFCAACCCLVYGIKNARFAARPF